MATSSDESEEVNRHAAQNKIKQKQRTPTHSAAFVVIQCPDIGNLLFYCDFVFIILEMVHLYSCKSSTGRNYWKPLFTQQIWRAYVRNKLKMLWRLKRTDKEETLNFKISEELSSRRSSSCILWVLTIISFQVKKKKSIQEMSQNNKSKNKSQKYREEN